MFGLLYIIMVFLFLWLWELVIMVELLEFISNNIVWLWVIIILYDLGVLFWVVLINILDNCWIGFFLKMLICWLILWILYFGFVNDIVFLISKLIVFALNRLLWILLFFIIVLMNDFFYDLCRDVFFGKCKYLFFYIFFINNVMKV